MNFIRFFNQNNLDFLQEVCKNLTTLKRAHTKPYNYLIKE